MAANVSAINAMANEHDINKLKVSETLNGHNKLGGKKRVSFLAALADALLRPSNLLSLTWFFLLVNPLWMFSASNANDVNRIADVTGMQYRFQRNERKNNSGEILWQHDNVASMERI